MATNSYLLIKTKSHRKSACETSASSLRLYVSSVETHLYHHHTAIRTRNIENSIQFFSLFGYNVETKFRSGPARCAWLTTRQTESQFKIDSKNYKNEICSRLELIEVPMYVLQEKEGYIKRATDLFQKEDLLGLNHFCLDVTWKCAHDLKHFLDAVNAESMVKFNKTLKIALPPKQQVIGSRVYEISFIYDADGSVIELLRYVKELRQNISSGWEPWDGLNFVGIDKNAIL